VTDLLFGLSVSASAAPGANPVADGVLAERLGFDFISTSDHPCGAEPSHEVWTMLTWIAAATSRIRIATRVLGVPYRPPAMVAKMAETLDRLSGGRLILGLGGGYSDDEFRAFGLRVPSPRDKVDGMVEAIQVIRGLWARSDFTFAGRHHHTDRATIAPKPDRHIPIWLGTFGPRALAATGLLADGWIPSYGFAPPQRIPAMLERIHVAARRAGRDPSGITCAYHLQVRLGDHSDPDSSVIAGSSAAVAERLAGFVRLGCTAFSVTPVGPDARGQAERFASEVIPAVRAAVT
jgi:probable F420-dependent oxidoreductase